VFRKIKVDLKGVTDLLMHKAVPEEITKKGKKRNKKYVPEEEAKKSAYIAEIDGEDRLYIPRENIFSMIVYTAGGFKIGRRSAKSYAAGSIRIEPDKIPLTPNKYEIYEKLARIGVAKVMTWRPRIRDWEASFFLIYDDTIFTRPKLLEEILVEAGKRVGLMDWRPQKGGWWGTFTVPGFKEID